jgi:hypothetical protein
MSMAELMRAAVELPAQQQNELTAFLLHLRRQQDAVWRTQMTRRIDDQDSSHGVNLESWKAELASGRQP